MDSYARYGSCACSPPPFLPPYYLPPVSLLNGSERMENVINA